MERIFRGIGLVRAAVLAALGTLALLALVPVLVGWRPTLVQSGSMEPAVRTGDVVVTAPLAPAARQRVRAGAVVLFRDPARPNRYLLHRIAGRNPDGTFRTKGDANLTADSTPVPADALIAVGRIRIPLIGVPVLRARQGDALPLAAFCVLTLAAAAAPPRRRGQPGGPGEPAPLPGGRGVPFTPLRGRDERAAR